MVKIKTAPGLSLKSFFVGVIEHLGVFLSHNNRVIGFGHDPGTLRIVHRAGSL
jgi:hypothetical protein